MSMRTFAPRLPALLALLASCASSEPLNMSLGAADEVVDVAVLGDGFVRQGTRRIPREAFVLELRQRGRAMTSEQLDALRVQVWLLRDGGDTTAADADWLLGQLQIIGVGQARMRFQP